MENSILLAAPVLLPVLAGILIAFIRRLDNRIAMRWYLGSVLTANLLLVLFIATRPNTGLVLLYLTDRLPIMLKVDDLSRLFCVMASIMFLLVGVFSFEYMEHEESPKRFYLFYLLALGFLMGIGLAGNLVTVYLFVEGMTLLTVPLVLHSLTKEAIAAAFKYLFYSVAGSAIALIGIFILYANGAAIDFVPGGSLAASGITNGNGLLLTSVLLAIIGFGTKAGMFPLHAWLPAAHPVAPAPASAILSGVITKAGALAVIRFVFYVAGADFIRGTWVQYTWLVLVSITILMGSVLAYKEQLLKKRFAYSSISQVSYILLGLSTLTASGVLGGLLHMIFHSIAKDALFLFAGAVAYKTGKTTVPELKGIGRRMPVTLGCFTLLSLSIVGIPPANGFLSKWHIATGALSADIGPFAWLGPAFLLTSALFSAGYLFPIAINGFFPGQDWEGDRKKTEAGLTMLFPIGLLSIMSIALGLFPQRLLSFLNGIVGGIV